MNSVGSGETDQSKKSVGNLGDEITNGSYSWIPTDN